MPDSACVFELVVKSTLKTVLMSDDFPDWRFPTTKSRNLWENTWVMSRVVWEDAPEVFGNDFPHFGDERSAGETILYSSSRSSP
jgi:hypothetical protein